MACSSGGRSNLGIRSNASGPHAVVGGDNGRTELQRFPDGDGIAVIERGTQHELGTEMPPMWPHGDVAGQQNVLAQGWLGIRLHHVTFEAA